MSRTEPFLGSGLGYRREIGDHIEAAADRIDFVELLTDQFIGDPRRVDEARRIRDVLPAVPHGIGLSIGSLAGPDPDYLRAVKTISDVCDATYYSEHLCTTRAPGIDIGHLSPLRFIEDLLPVVVRHVKQVQEFLERRLVLENVTYLFEVPGSTLSQADFFRALVDETGCGILLDLTNAYINGLNHHFAPEAFIADLPLGSVVQVHLAGGYWSDGVLVDSHSKPVHEPVWDLLTALCHQVDVPAIVLEHDAQFPDDVEELFEQVERARRIQRESRDRPRCAG